MRVVLLVNNWLGWKVTEWLRQSGTDIAALVIHPPDRRTYGEETVRAAGLGQDAIFGAESLQDEVTLQRLGALRADLAVSILFGYLLRPPFLSLFPHGAVNIHPALLPYNRGQYPNVWSIVEGTPAGVTLHCIDGALDRGDILAQREVPVTAFDTGETLYRRLERASLELFQESWPLLVAGVMTPRPQSGEGSYHRTRDVEAIDEIDLDRAYGARHLLNVLRARTFPPHGGAYFRDGGRKVYVRVQLIPEEKLEESP